MASVTLSNKFQLSIPKAVREELHLHVTRRRMVARASPSDAGEIFVPLAVLVETVWVRGIHDNRLSHRGEPHAGR